MLILNILKTNKKQRREAFGLNRSTMNTMKLHSEKGKLSHE